MRYSNKESTYILGIFSSGDTVTIDAYRLSDNAKVIDCASCLEVETTGIFKYEFSQTITQKEEYLWIMSNSEYSKCGKIVLGGYMDGIENSITAHRNAAELQIKTIGNLINELLDIEEGDWGIKDNQMIFYKRNGSELMRFNLFDKSGHPAEVNVFKRERI